VSETLPESLVRIITSLPSLPSELWDAPTSGSDIDLFVNHFIHNDKILYISPEIGSEIPVGDLDSPTINITPESITNKDYLVVPICIESCHWIVILIDYVRGASFWFDPLGPFSEFAHAAEVCYKLIVTKINSYKFTKFINPPTCHIDNRFVQVNSSDCGLFVCLFLLSFSCLSFCPELSPFFFVVFSFLSLQTLIPINLDTERLLLPSSLTISLLIILMLMHTVPSTSTPLLLLFFLFA